MIETANSFCRACHNQCPVIVQVEDGRLLSVKGDPENPLWAGYTCIKGRGQPSVLGSADRLRHSLKRAGDGRRVEVSSEQAMDEIAAVLMNTIEQHGPRSVAGYFGTYAVANNLTQPFFAAFLKAIGSGMVFSPDTIDKPGKKIARAMHGNWMAPLQTYHRPDVALLIGTNPLQSYFGAACGHPNRWLNERLEAGMQLIVIDPRRTQTAARATLHLMPVPGQDVLILAALIHVILAEELYDRQFIAENVQGLEALREAVAGATPEFVAARAQLDASDLVQAARIFAAAGRGYLCAGVGPSFSASTTLVEYLVLNLETLCGHWMRDGEELTRVPSLLPMTPPKAQAMPPEPWALDGEVMHARDLPRTPAGLPTSALPDEILTDREDRVRVLLSCGGSPVGAWPDQLRSLEAMDRLDLFVQLDPWLSASAEAADYVIAPTMSYEVAAATFLTDMFHAGTYYYGVEVPHSQYTEAVAEPPPDSDVLPEWEFFYGLAQRMGLQLVLEGYVFAGSARVAVDMVTKPSDEELLEALAAGGRVSLAEVRRYPHGVSVTEPPVFVAPKDAGWEGRLELADGRMMKDLSTALAAAQLPVETDPDKPFRLLCRRIQQNYNTSKKDPAITKSRGYNPAFMHPDDLQTLGLKAGEAVVIASQRSSIPAVVQPDNTLLRGMVSMPHGFGAGPDHDHEFRQIGSSTSRLVDGSDVVDAYSGMPRMSDIPVSVRPLGG